MEWVRFDESDRSTYPPVNETVLISYNTNSYSAEAEYIGFAELKPNHTWHRDERDNAELHWFIDSTTGDSCGTSPLENSAEPYGQFSTPWVFVKHWAPAKPYKPDSDDGE